MTALGLSPRVRGNPQASQCGRLGLGPIPACAGEPAGADGARLRDGAYPRVCGGTDLLPDFMFVNEGLSPRVRGNHVSDVAGALVPGPIPACAGEPVTSRSRAAAQRAYPRVCGGTIRRGSSTTCSRGLSPRVRGNPLRAHPARWCPGPIPACAGEPCDLNGLFHDLRAYPRVCGGTRREGASTARLSGLSPRMRGNHNGQDFVLIAPGPIPACAGEPRNRGYSLTACRAYPRVCGGTALAPHLLEVIGGLSPRVRGNPPALVRGDYLPGPIPACAGEPLFLFRSVIILRAYPRVCGGTTHQSIYAIYDAGLSPRVRGNLTPLHLSTTTIGPIPACAGEP